jgi:hypothetical protein
MTDQSDADETPVVGGGIDKAPDDAAEAADETADEAALEAYDLDGDGRISLTEDTRAVLGMADARAEELAAEPGLKGKFNRVVHRILDKLDND